MIVSVFLCAVSPPPCHAQVCDSEQRILNAIRDRMGAVESRLEGLLSILESLAHRTALSETRLHGLQVQQELQRHDLNTMLDSQQTTHSVLLQLLEQQKRMVPNLSVQADSVSCSSSSNTEGSSSLYSPAHGRASQSSEEESDVDDGSMSGRSSDTAQDPHVSASDASREVQVAGHAVPEMCLDPEDVVQSFRVDAPAQEGEEGRPDDGEPLNSGQ